ncbi:MAG: glycosyltransferase family 2 protein [Anaerolineaceae bacterium]|nr:glycosyltransferase family 2 protein [Anaerolineaceae bacterium]
MKLSVIIPVYNEEPTLSLILERVRAVDLGGIEKEILLVDDCSRDGSKAIIEKEALVAGTRAFYHPVNHGKGAAIRTALENIQGDLVIIQDADLEYDPQDYTRLIASMQDNGVNVVYGSRFKGDSDWKHLSHWLGNKMLTLVTNILYGVTLSDMETCYKLFKADVIRPIPLHSRRFEFEPEITAKVLKRGNKILEVPISYQGRAFNEGKKITWRDGFIAMWTLIKYRFVD